MSNYVNRSGCSSIYSKTVGFKGGNEHKTLLQCTGLNAHMIPLPSLLVLVLQQQSLFCCAITTIIFLQQVQPSRLKLIQSHSWCHFSSTINGNAHFHHDKTWNLKGRHTCAATQLKLESWSQMSVGRCGLKAVLCNLNYCVYPIQTLPANPQRPCVYTEGNKDSNQYIVCPG